MSNLQDPIAIYYEHPDWFRPLMRELERRGVPYVEIDARHHSYDVAEPRPAYSLLFNRMSPSAYLRGLGHSIFYTLGYLDHIERLGTRVVNGSTAFGFEISKARQMTLMQSLGIAYPKARVINHPAPAGRARTRVGKPLQMDTHVGGSGAGITKFDTPASLTEAIAADSLDLGIDQTALVQEFIPKRDGRITRVETVGGKYLYGINVYAPGEQFNLCPADACQTTDGVELLRGACPIDAPRTGMRVEGYTPPPEVVAAIEAIVRAAKIDVGGIEYMVDDRDGSLVYYDVNALSNFVADAVNVIGFDPHARLVDFLMAERG